MSIIISLLLIGISLSMDTFSICLSIGTYGINKKITLLLTFLVGIMHFIMPLFGNMLGSKMTNYLNINVNFLLGIILVFIAIEMIMSLIKNDKDYFDLNLINLFLISISVSLDSFSTGFGLNAIVDNKIIAGVFFSICAASFTFLGLLIGKYGKEKLGIYSNIIGIIILLIIGISHILKTI